MGRALAYVNVIGDGSRFVTQGCPAACRVTSPGAVFRARKCAALGRHHPGLRAVADALTAKPSPRRRLRRRTVLVAAVFVAAIDVATPPQPPPAVAAPSRDARLSQDSPAGWPSFVSGQWRLWGAKPMAHRRQQGEGGSVLFTLSAGSLHAVDQRFMAISRCSGSQLREAPQREHLVWSRREISSLSLMRYACA